MFVKKVVSLGFLFLITGGMLNRDCAVSSNNSIKPEVKVSMSQGKPVESNSTAQTPNDSISSAIAESQTKFAIKLFQALTQDNSETNTVISPLSVGLALSMLYNGAEGVTQTELSSLLEIMDLSIDEVNQGNLSLTEILENADSQVEIAIANSLWTKLNFPLQQSFLQTNQEYYNATVQELDFNQPTSVETINNWVANNTQNKITKIIDRINPDQALFLLNAIYFKGQWQSKFNPENTSEQDFYLANGETIQQPMMSNFGSYQYYENSQLQVINLPYGSSGNLGMNIFLPPENSSLSQLLAQLNQEQLTTWQQQMISKKGNLTLPRFTQEYETELNSVLQKLGASNMFNPAEANFSALSEQSVAVDTIKHKAVIEVNEEGTEAAATTSVGVVTTSAEIPFNMIVNRPFFYTIQDRQTGIILFMGTVQNPQ